MADRPNIHDVRTLTELEYVSDVQLHLDAGWVLVKAPAGDELFYVLGWPGDGEPPRPKGPTLADLHAEIAEEVARDLAAEEDGEDPELED